MEKSRLKILVRALLVICSGALVAVLFVPMWRIDLVAPQYPEGLMLQIFPNRLGGNVDIINGLNHYIGMKTLHTEDFIEFKVLPYIIGFFAAAFLLTAIVARRKVLNLLAILFVSFGVLAMYDFWRWEYNYGHNLNPDAAIIVPGMAYQPPLIGFKQLLNFGAYSIPDLGGWLFVGVGVVLILCVFIEWRAAKRKVVQHKTFSMVFLVLLAGLGSCNAGPEPIKTGVDQCYFCKMTVSDARFGAEMVSKKGKVFKFDDISCMLSYMKMDEQQMKDEGKFYVVDFCGAHTLLDAQQAKFLKSDALKSPMGGNVAAFQHADSLRNIQQQFAGNQLQWDDLQKQ